LDILADLARAGFCDVDLVFLDTYDIVLKYEAVRQNKLVYNRGDFDWGLLFPGCAPVPGFFAMPGSTAQGLSTEGYG
jgi:hypothetical protein